MYRTLLPKNNFVQFPIWILLVSIQTLFLNHDIKSQNMYVASQTAQASPEPTKELLDILYSYLSYEERQTISSERYQLILEEYKQNPFIGSYIQDFEITDSFLLSLNQNEAFGLNLLNQAGTAISGLNVTPYVDAFVKFAIKRTKEELYVAFFKDLQTRLQDPHMKTLFPNSYGMLDVIDEDIYRFKYFLNAIVASFEQDMIQMPTHVNHLLIQESVIPNTYNQQLVEDFLDIVQELTNGESMDTALSSFLSVNDKKLTDISLEDLQEIKPAMNIRSTLGFASLLNKSLKDGSSSGNYIPVELLQTLTEGNQQRHLDFFLGFIWQQVGSKMRLILDDGQDHIFRHYLAQIKNQNSGENYLTTLISIIKRAEQIITDKKRINAETSDSVKEMTAAFYTNINQSLGILGDFTQSILPPNEKQEANKYNLPIQSALNLHVDIKRKNYTAAVLHLMNLLETLIANKKLTQNLLKVGTFIANVAEAENSDQLAEIIEAYALPAGSYRTKRQSKFNVALNSYMGLNYGQEYLINDNLPSIMDNSNATMGLSTPIGIALSRSILEKSSLTGFFQLFDLGSIAAFRFGDDATEVLPEINFSNIIAPGAYLSFGFPNFPGALSAGAQLGPNLREVTDASLMIDDVRAWRFLGTLTVDIPLMNFHNKE